MKLNFSCTFRQVVYISDELRNEKTNLRQSAPSESCDSYVEFRGNLHCFLNEYQSIRKYTHSEDSDQATQMASFAVVRLKRIIYPNLRLMNITLRIYVVLHTEDCLSFVASLQDKSYSMRIRLSVSRPTCFFRETL